VSDMEKAVYDRIKSHTGIDNRILDYLSGSRERFIYGIGAQAAVCLGLFREMEVPIEGALLPAGIEVSPMRGYWGRMIDTANLVPISKLTQRQIADAAVLITTPKDTYQEVTAYLKLCGFQSIFTCAWGRNQYLRDICIDRYAEQYS